MISAIGKAQNSVYDFTLKSIDGKDLPLSQFKGKKLLLVNVASECGYTPQYDGLEKLFEKYKDKLVIVGVPANNFGQQEQGTNEEIKEFCKTNYHVTFYMTQKVSAKGEDIDPFFKWLIELPNADFTGDIRWNFEKFLFDEKGNLVHRFRSKTKPESEEMLRAITG